MPGPTSLLGVGMSRKGGMSEGLGMSRGDGYVIGVGLPLQLTPSGGHHMVPLANGWCASYWNAVLFFYNINQFFILFPSLLL